MNRLKLGSSMNSTFFAFCFFIAHRIATTSLRGYILFLDKDVHSCSCALNSYRQPMDFIIAIELEKMVLMMKNRSEIKNTDVQYSMKNGFWHCCKHWIMIDARNESRDTIFCPFLLVRSILHQNEIIFKAQYTIILRQQHALRYKVRSYCSRVAILLISSPSRI